jgi:hypothetical protein
VYWNILHLCTFVSYWFKIFISSKQCRRSVTKLRFLLVRMLLLPLGSNRSLRMLLLPLGSNRSLRMLLLPLGSNRSLSMLLLPLGSKRSMRMLTQRADWRPPRWNSRIYLNLMTRWSHSPARCPTFSSRYRTHGEEAEVSLHFSPKYLFKNLKVKSEDRSLLRIRIRNDQSGSYFRELRNIL